MKLCFQWYLNFRCVLLSLAAFTFILDLDFGGTVAVATFFLFLLDVIRLLDDELAVALIFLLLLFFCFLLGNFSIRARLRLVCFLFEFLELFFELEDLALHFSELGVGLRRLVLRTFFLHTIDLLLRRLVLMLLFRLLPWLCFRRADSHAAESVGHLGVDRFQLVLSVFESVH